MGFGGMAIEPKPGFWRDFWSDVDDVVNLTSVATDTLLPDIVVSGLDTDITIERVVLILKVRAIENTDATGTNGVDGVQAIKVKEDSEAWAAAIDAINIPDNMWLLGSGAREAGDIIVGDDDVKATVTGNGTYNVRWEDAKVDRDNLQLNDLQIGLRIYWKV